MSNNDELNNISKSDDTENNGQVNTRILTPTKQSRLTDKDTNRVSNAFFVTPQRNNLRQDIERE